MKLTIVLLVALALVGCREKPVAASAGHIEYDPTKRACYRIVTNEHGEFRAEKHYEALGWLDIDEPRRSVDLACRDIDRWIEIAKWRATRPPEPPRPPETWRPLGYDPCKP